MKDQLSELKAQLWLEIEHEMARVQKILNGARPEDGEKFLARAALVFASVRKMDEILHSPTITAQQDALDIMRRIR